MDAAPSRLSHFSLLSLPPPLFPPKPSTVPAASFLPPPPPPDLVLRQPRLLRSSLSPPGSCHDVVLRSSLLSCMTPSSSTAAGENPPSCRIFIKGLSHSTSEGVLAKTFSLYGEVKKVKIITSKSSKESLGLAYIWFACEEDAMMAVMEMDGKFFDGRFIAVRIARPESPSTQIKARPYRF